jgi:rRNA maturation RNase YbeY
MNDLRIGMALVDNKKMRELNKNYRKVDEPTDVLSFPYNEDLPEGVYFLGEIVVNVDEVKTKEEIIERVVHGAKDLLESVNGVNAPPR